jgi:hypothetical protein
LSNQKYKDDKAIIDVAYLDCLKEIEKKYDSEYSNCDEQLNTLKRKYEADIPSNNMDKRTYAMGRAMDLTKQMKTLQKE